MKTLSIVIAAFILVFGTAASRAENVDRISATTGIPVATLQAERASTGLGWGSLEKAHLLASATGQSFDNVVALHQSGQGWGKIAHDNGLNLGTLVSNAHRSTSASTHAENPGTMPGKSGTRGAKSRSAKMSTTRGLGHRSSGFSRSHGARSVRHTSRSHGMGHGGGR